MSGEAHQHRRVLRQQPKGRGENIAGGRPRCRFVLSSLPLRLVAAIALVALGLPQPAPAETFDQASFRVLAQICASEPPSLEDQKVGLNLITRCRSNTPAGAVSAAPAAVSPQASAGPTIERRLQAVRESEERRREAGATRAIYAS
jgi:hypothetical protein